MSDLNCKKCQSKQYVRNGHVRGFQRYKCRVCGCQFTVTPRRGKDPALKSLAIVLYAYCGMSMGNIARLTRVSTVAVMKWIRAASEAVEAPKTGPAEVVMIDEMWHFVNGKKTKFGSGEPLTGYRVPLSASTWAIVAIQTCESS